MPTTGPSTSTTVAAYGGGDDVVAPGAATGTGSLPRTGDNDGVYTLVAFALIACGVMMLYVARARRDRSAAAAARLMTSFARIRHSEIERR